MLPQAYVLVVCTAEVVPFQCRLPAIVPLESPEMRITQCGINSVRSSADFRYNTGTTVGWRIAALLRDRQYCNWYHKKGNVRVV